MWCELLWVVNIYLVFKLLWLLLFVPEKYLFVSPPINVCVFCVLLQTHHKHFLHFGDAFAKDGAKLISNTSQKETKQRYPQQSIDNTEYSSAFSVGRDVSKTCREHS